MIDNYGVVKRTIETMSSREIADWVLLDAFKPSVPRTEVVYLIECDGEVKIGRSVSPKSRVRSVLTIAGRAAKSVWVLAGEYDACAAEGYLHRVFEAQRGVGEWFSVCPDAIKREAITAALPSRPKKKRRSADEIFDAMMTHFHREDWTGRSGTRSGKSSALTAS